VTLPARRLAGRQGLAICEGAGRVGRRPLNRFVAHVGGLSCPKVLILDKPTRGIDIGAKAEVHALMARLAEQGVAILMISSELPEILGMSHRVLVMREGHIVAEFPREDASEERLMAATMGQTAMIA
jgi:ABC-type sugar transport system ATPase subunit